MEINSHLKTIVGHGIDAERAEIAERAEDVRSALENTALQIVPEKPSNAVTALRCPARNAKAIIERAKTAYGMWLCPNGGPLADGLFCIGHIVTITAEDNRKLIDALVAMSVEGLF